MTEIKQQPQNQAVATQPQNGVKKFEEGTVDIVLSRIAAFQTNGDLRLPPNYSPENAVRSAWLILQDVKDLNKQPALQVCSKESIANALLDMVLQGLSPVKKQCYFVVYGNKLSLQKSYIGNIAVSKRVANVKEVKAVPIYEGDTFKYEINLETGRKKIIEHTQEFKNIDPDKVAGAYAIVTQNDNGMWCEVMNIKQIRKAWEMGPAKGNSPAHKNFTDEMACKTVVNRALKIAIGSSDDGDLFLDEEQFEDVVSSHVRHQVSENANKKEMGMDDNRSNIVTIDEGNNNKGESKETSEEQPQNNSGEKPPF